MIEKMSKRIQNRMLSWLSYRFNVGIDFPQSRFSKKWQKLFLFCKISTRILLSFYFFFLLRLLQIFHMLYISCRIKWHSISASWFLDYKALSLISITRMFFFIKSQWKCCRWHGQLWFHTLKWANERYSLHLLIFAFERGAGLQKVPRG